ncbi:MAG TPA: protocatechuate 3,4-dioxygenase subunit alpha [Anaeromyxobacteraceae bacterium]|nr:protocatechuate 3,4-dioxygenase subunit alpha [Anaeromyxobacteraceae bacterium]
MSLYPTASQTVGPYLRIGFAWLTRSEVVPPGTRGERVVLSGRVLDGDGRPVSDALVEVWQADASGRYPLADEPHKERASSGLLGFGRVPTDPAGAFRFTTVKPGRVPGPDGALQAPHLAVTIFMRGLLRPLLTRVYFPGEPSNGEDPILKLVDPSRRATLVARPGASGPSSLEWNVILQGADETVFFDP